MSDTNQLTPERAFAARVSRSAGVQCQRLLGTERGAQAAQRITMSILGAMQSARDPSAIARCSEASIANCIALSAQTGLLPGGPNPTVYLVPQSGDLQWRITHRGIAVLAYRAGFALRVVPVASSDFLRVSLGEVVEHDGTTSEWPSSLEEVAGFAVCVRDRATGQDVARAWVPRKIIEARRRKSRQADKGPWAEWPIEMGMGAAIRYVMSRGMLPIDSPELSAALAPEVEEPQRHREQAPAAQVEPPQAPAALLEDGPPTHELAPEAVRERETVPARSEP